MGRDMIQQNLANIYADFTLTTTETNTTKVLENLDLLDEEIEGYEGSFASFHYRMYESVVSAGPENITWGQIFNTTGKDDYYPQLNTTHFWGMQGENALNTSRFEKLLGFGNQMVDLTQTGVYLDSSTAKKMDLSAGDVISIGKFAYFWDEIEEESSNVTAEVNNIPVLGVFTVFNLENFHRLIQNQQWAYYSSNDIIMLGNYAYMHTITNNISKAIEQAIIDRGGTYYDYNEQNTQFYGVMINHDTLPLMNINALKSTLTQIKTRISVIGSGFRYQISSPITDVIESIQVQLRIYQTIFVLISLPVIILGWFLCKTNFLLSYHNRRKEIALLKCKGGISRKLTRVFLLESILIGLTGGVVGVVLGNLSSKLVLQKISPSAAVNYSLFQTMDLTQWLIGIGMGLVISLLAVIKPLRNYMKYKPIDGLQEYHEAAQTTLPTKKKDFVFLVIGILPIIITAFNLDASSWNPLIMALITLSTALMVISPFLLTYSLVKILCASKRLFQHVITGISRIFGRKLSVLASKNIIQNRTRSFRLVFIVSMALSFILMATTIQASELRYQEDIRLVGTGGGIRISYYNWGSPSINTANLTDYLRDGELNGSIHDVAWMFQYQESRIKGYSYGDDWIWEAGGIRASQFDNNGPAVIYGTSIANLTSNIAFQDTWFPNHNAAETLAKLTTVANSTIIPSSLADEGYKIDDSIVVEYRLLNGSIQERSLLVVGIYEIFPIVSMNSYQQTLIVDNATMTDGIVNQIDLVVYPSQNASGDALTYDQIELNLLSFDASGQAYNPVEYLQDDNQMISATVNFLDLESYYLLTIVTFAIGFIMYISITEKSRDFGVLRARGVDKKTIFRIQLAEGTILMIFGGIIGLIGIIGAQVVVLNLNSINLFSSLKRVLVIPWWKLLAQLASTIFLFTASVGLSVYFETKKSDLGRIAEILRV